MDPKIRRELRFHRAYVAVSAVAFATISLGAFARAGERVRFEEIDVERINVIEPDGTPRLILSNSSRSPDVVINGDTLGNNAGRRPGIILYNDQGDETGGLIFGSHVDENGQYSAGGQLSFDQYDQDQVVALRYIDRNGSRFAGLTVWDRPKAPLPEIARRYEAMHAMPEGEVKETLRDSLDALSPVRVFVGRSTGASAVLRLQDAGGRTRIRMEVDSLGNPRLDFLDENGRVTHSFPEASSPP